jgi:hypothetical protein
MEKNFMTLGFELIDSKEYRKIMTSNKGIEMTYQFLRRHIIRAPMKHKAKNDVYKNYFLNGKLATTITLEHLAEFLFLNRKTVKKNIDLLVDFKFIIQHDMTVKFREGPQRFQKVYELGRWYTESDLNDQNETYHEFIYANNVVRSPIFNIHVADIDEDIEK